MCTQIVHDYDLTWLEGGNQDLSNEGHEGEFISSSLKDKGGLQLV
jgi:hypothetical protein